MSRKRKRAWKKGKVHNITYASATGPIAFTLKDDLLFHLVMQNSKAALAGLVCALKGIDPATVIDCEVKNPIDINKGLKETIMDLKLTLNNNEIINIELQLYLDKYWESRSLLYLCRAYNSIKESEDYSKLMPTTHFCITDKNLFKGNTAFFSRFYLMEEKTHQIYSKKISIGVVQLQYIENASKDDEEHKLVYWAKLFNATTWEEFKALAKGNPVIEEVGNLMLHMNVDETTRSLLEGQKKYREQFASQYTAGYTDAEEKYEPIITRLSEQNSDLLNNIAIKDAALVEKDAALAEKDAALAEKDAALADKDAALADKDAALADKDAALADKDAALVNNEATIVDMEATIKRLQAELDKHKE